MVKLSSGIELNPNELTSEDREAIVKTLKETKRGTWRPKQGDEYYSVNSFNSVYHTIWGMVDEEGDSTDKAALEIGNVFKTASEAEKHLAYLKALQILRGDTRGYEYNTGDTYYKVYFNIDRDEFEYDYSTSLVCEGIKFEELKDAKASVNAHAAEWHIVLGVE